MSREDRTRVAAEIEPVDLRLFLHHVITASIKLAVKTENLIFKHKICGKL